ncbi:MAG TPA: FlgD immunoglobulin-like domain containing protein [Candidatus Krumholzibacteria bacterium]|nr:FlgD immunoglobulin-like domain containing protein [Candidatus Krumholzibacteria bacterium]HPD73071.1 FlgD immunoglobulin-like domain containing protein [Candidatus Krumholzibacteria bacterium]HRY41871.1 FlgD immunoglobulin-like domain containing protein [Candidatus Krumholzibacteria bacterium]
MPSRIRSIHRWLACLVFVPVVAHAGALDELHGCVQSCLAAHEEIGWSFYLDVRDCLDSWEAQKGAVNLAFAPSSTGYQHTPGLPNLLVIAGEPVTAVFALQAADKLERVDLYLHRGGAVPSSPQSGELVGFDANPDDGWSITFPTEAYADFRGILVARAHFAGHDEQIDGDQAIIFIETSLPPDIPQPRLLDVAATGLTLTDLGDGMVAGTITLEVAVGDDFSPALALEVEIEVAGRVAEVVIDLVELAAGPLDCYVASPPLCDGGCPINVECKAIDIWPEWCACNFLEVLDVEFPAHPGDLVVVRLDRAEAWPEVDESNNAVGGFVPAVSAGASPAAGSLITGVANHPNPFNPQTVLKFTLARPADARIEIVDARGHQIREFARRRYAAGPNSVLWDGCDDQGRPQPSGIYRYRILAGRDVGGGTAALIR